MTENHEITWHSYQGLNYHYLDEITSAPIFKLIIKIMEIKIFLLKTRISQNLAKVIANTIL